MGGATTDFINISEFCLKKPEFLMFPESRFLKDSRAKCNEVGYEVQMSWV